MPVDYGNVADTLHGKPGYAVRHEHAVLKRLADLAVRRYEALPPKVAARTPIQQYVSQEVMNLLGTLSHHNVEKEKIARYEAKKAAEKAMAEARVQAMAKPSVSSSGLDFSGIDLSGITKPLPPMIFIKRSAPPKPVASSGIDLSGIDFTKVFTKPPVSSSGIDLSGIDFTKVFTKPPVSTTLRGMPDSDAVVEAPTSTTVADPFDEEDPMVFAALKDNYKIGQDEIRATFGKNRKDRDIFFNQLHGVGKSSLTQASEIGNYLSDQHQDMSKAIIDEMTENYLDNILPKANVGFMGGAWNTPQRSTHQERVLRNLHKDVSRNLAHMRGRAHEKGLEEAGQQQTRQLYASQAAHDILNKQQESAATASDILASVESKKLGSDMLKLELARNVGAEEQAQAGQKLEEVQRHALRQQEHRFEMAERELAALRGVAPQSMSTMHLMQQNPNYAAIGAGGLGNMAAAMFTNQMKKSGGLIQKYAPGGIVKSNIKKDPETLLMEQEAQSLLNAPYDQRQAVLHGVARMGDKIAERYTGMPGIAGDFIDTQMAHKNAHDVQRVRGLNLMQQVQASRVKQQNFLAELEFKNKHHSETLGETSRHNKVMEGLQGSRVAQSGGPGFSGPGGGSITDRKAAREAVAALRRSKSMKRELSTLGELSSKIKTGPVRGLLNSGYLKSEDANKMEVGANKLILDMHQGMKNIPRSEEFMKRIESTKPNVNNYPEANKMALKMMAEGVEDIEQNSIDTLLAAGYTIEDIQHILQEQHAEAGHSQQVAPSSSGSSQLQMMKAARAAMG